MSSTIHPSFFHPDDEAPFQQDDIPQEEPSDDEAPFQQDDIPQEEPSDDEAPFQQDDIPQNASYHAVSVPAWQEAAFPDHEFPGAFPAFQAGGTSDDQASRDPGNLARMAPGARRTRRFSLLLRFTLILLILLVVSAVIIRAYYAGMITTQPTGQHNTTSGSASRRSARMPSALPTQRLRPPAVASAVGGALHLPLPPGWNRSLLDAENALHVAALFTQQEMRIDYRDVGTLWQKSGTMRASVFLLDAQAQALRFPNDRRSTAAFFLQVEQEQLIQTPVFVDPPFVSIPRIVQAQTTQDGNFFVWVNVPFLLLHQHGGLGQPGFDLDPQSQQPRVHTLQVLLITVPRGTGPLAGVDYAVSDYALDRAGLITIPARP